MRKLTLREQLSQIPGLTVEGIEWLLDLVDGGATVTVYQSVGRWNIELLPVNADAQFDHRWSVAAWNAYVRGEHLTDAERPCMCYACQRRRQRCANLRYAIREAEEVLANPASEPKMREGLADLIEHARQELVRLEAPEGVHA
jgi:hypothetical protein